MSFFIKYYDLQYIAKSPYKLSMTEKRVIGGLQKLTDLLFKQYYKQNPDEDNDNEVDGNMQSDEVTMSSDVPTSTTKLRLNKENDENIHQFSDKGAEKFCAMVVNQLTRGTDEVAQADEWHRGQLNAYDTAQQHFFG